MSGSPESASAGGLRRLASAALLVLLACLAHGRALGNGFVNFDDPDYVTGNPHVARGLDGDTLRWAATSTRAANWHPLTWLSHALDVELFGLAPVGHHATSLLFHALGTVLLFLFLAPVTRPGVALATAALFAVHPLRVESVAWVSERKDVLAGALWMGTLVAWGAWTRRGGAGRYLAALLLHALGLCAKPMGVTLPFVLLLLDVWPLGRAALPPGRRLRATLPFFLLAAASCVVTYRVQAAGGAVSGFEAVSAAQRVANALVSVWAYVFALVVPVGLAPFYPHPALVGAGTSTLAASAAALALAAATVLAWRERRSAPWFLVGWLWYLGTLVPVLGLVQVGAQARADRYAYLPTVGLTLALVAGAAELLAGRRALARGLAAVAVLALAAASVRQASFWRSSEVLWTRAVDVTERNYFALHDLGVARLAAGDLAGARDAFRSSLAIAPANPGARLGLGVALARTGDLDGAERELRETLARSPDLAAAHEALAGVLAERGQLDQAVDEARQAVRLDPDLVPAWNRLGDGLLALGRDREALDALLRANALAPDTPAILANLGRAYGRLGEDDLAAVALRRALVLGGGHPAVAALLADLLATSSRAGLRNGPQALELATHAARGPGARRPEALSALAAAQAETGAFEEAAATQARVLELLAREEGGVPAVDPEEAAARLAAYRAGRAWRR